MEYSEPSAREERSADFIHVSEPISSPIAYQKDLAIFNGTDFRYLLKPLAVIMSFVRGIFFCLQQRLFISDNLHSHRLASCIFSGYSVLALLHLPLAMLSWLRYRYRRSLLNSVVKFLVLSLAYLMLFGFTVFAVVLIGAASQ